MPSPIPLVLLHMSMNTCAHKTKEKERKQVAPSNFLSITILQASEHFNSLMNYEVLDPYLINNDSFYNFYSEAQTIPAHILWFSSIALFLFL